MALSCCQFLGRQNGLYSFSPHPANCLDSLTLMLAIIRQLLPEAIEAAFSKTYFACDARILFMHVVMFDGPDCFDIA